MLLISLLIAVFVKQLWEHANPLHRDEWIAPWHNSIKHFLARFKLTDPTTEFAVGLMTCCTLIVLVTHFLYSQSPLLYVLFASAILLYSFGRGELSRLITQFIVAVAKQDWGGAKDVATQLNVNTHPIPALNWPQLNAQVLSQCGYLGFERFFAVVFWFALLGPVGAFAYRFTHLWLKHVEPKDIPEQTPKINLEKNDDITRWLWLIEWPAIRVLGISYAITGNFSSCLQAWKNSALCRYRSSQDVLLGSLLAALSVDEKTPQTQEVTRRELEAIEQLQSRTLWFWIGSIALLLLIL